jgi:hypothetical protein
VGIVRTLIIVALVIIAVRLLRRLLAPKRRAFEDRATASIEGEEMVRDPACGKYLQRRGALIERVHGESLHFCSEACREAYARGVRAIP